MSHVDRAVTTVLPSRAAADRAVSAWLLGATESRDRSRMEWQALGVTMLKSGVVFSAIRMSARLVRAPGPRAWSARLVHAAAGTSDIDAVDGYLMRALVGGPVIHDPDRCRYYALIPTAVGRPWEVTRDLEPLGLGSYVGVPSPGLNAATASSRTPYWSVPMESAGTLCVPAAVAALVEIARYELAGQASAADAPVSPSPRERRR